jgi:plastocyanin
MKRLIAIVAMVLAVSSTGTGAVMGQNMDELPPGCEGVAGWDNITIRGGTDQAGQFPGTVFTYSQRDFEYEPCTRLTVTFINTDETRHQWMVHGLPATIHDMGMFTLDVDGNSNETGTFILPGFDDTMLIHCGLPQHMQKGMKAQIVVGEGDGNIPNIPGHTGSWESYDYPRESPLPAGVLIGFTTLVVGALLAAAGIKWYRRRPDDEE